MNVKALKRKWDRRGRAKEEGRTRTAGERAREAAARSISRWTKKEKKIELERGRCWGRERREIKIICFIPPPPYPD